MEDKKTVYSTKMIARALGVALVFFLLIVFLSPATAFWPLGYGVYYVFGQVGYWLYLPFLFLLGGVIAIRGTLKKSFLHWDAYAGVFVISLGLMVLLSQLAFQGKEDVASYSLFQKAVDAYQGRSATGLFFSDKIGGGVAGYYLAAGILKGGEPLLWTLIVVFLFGGLVLTFFPLWKKLFLSLIRLIKTQRAKRAAQKETARLKEEALQQATREEQNAPLQGDYTPIMSQAEDSAAPLEKDNAPIPTVPVKEETTPEEEAPTLSRSELYGQRRSSPIPSSIEPTPEQLNHPFVSPNEMAHSGLQEAVFEPDGALTSTASALHSETLSSEPDLTPETGVHSNEIRTPDEETVAPAPQTLKPVAAPRSNEIPTSAPLPSPKTKTPSYEAPSAPTPRINVEAKPTPSPVIVEQVPNPKESSPSFVFTPAPAERKDETIVVAPLKETKPMEAQPIEPSFVTPSKATPVPAEAVPSSADNPAKPASLKPEPLVQETPKAPIPAAPIAPKPAPVPVPAPAPAPVSPLDQCNQPKAAALPPYHFPSIDLLKTYPANANQEQMKLECQSRAATINQALSDLGAGAQVVGYTIGPSVTRFDIQTDKDVSVASLGRYVQDISVRLNGVATRFEEVVRGKSTSGLEIANSTTTTVSLREMVEALPKGDKYNLYIPFGKSISGECISADLSEFPHLLVSGSTGSGKSIFMHGLIMSLLMRNRPEDLKLVVVDPKRVEMGKYKDIPHLLCPIIKEPSQAKVCFQKLIDEMERRYTLFELSGVSNIRQFNTEYAPEAGFAKLPFIVVVVDEYADLVDTCKDIGDGVVRLAQKARAAGIHLVIATQRPSVQVITGVIKANLPVRVALSVSSAVDSMTILGQGGAEDLAGHGDMLVDCSLVARNGFTRCQGCFVDNKEIKAVVDDIKAQQNVVYDPNFLDLVDHEAEAKAAAAAAPQIDKAELKAKGDDDLYETIKTDIMAQEYTSISRIQRSYGVGFPRAGKIFARLQSEGVVALQPDTASSSKGCRVLIHDSTPAPENAGSSDQSTLSLTPNAPGGNPNV